MQKEGINNGLLIVRMDIEGYEKEALKGMTDLLESGQDIWIFIEIHPSRTDTGYIADILQEKDFSPEYISRDGGETYKKFKDLSEIKSISSNTHIMLSRL